MDSAQRSLRVYEGRNWVEVTRFSPAEISYGSIVRCLDILRFISRTVGLFSLPFSYFFVEKKKKSSCNPSRLVEDEKVRSTTWFEHKYTSELDRGMKRGSDTKEWAQTCNTTRMLS